MACFNFKKHLTFSYRFWLLITTQVSDTLRSRVVCHVEGLEAFLDILCKSLRDVSWGAVTRCNDTALIGGSHLMKNPARYTFVTFIIYISITFFQDYRYTLYFLSPLLCSFSPLVSSKGPITWRTSARSLLEMLMKASFSLHGKHFSPG